MRLIDDSWWLLVLLRNGQGSWRHRPQHNRQRPFSRTCRRGFCYTKGNHVPLKRPCSNYETGLARALGRSGLRLASSLARPVLARTLSRETHSTAMLAGQTTLDVFSEYAKCEKLKAGDRAETIRDTPAELCVPHFCGHLAACSRRYPSCAAENSRLPVGTTLSGRPVLRYHPTGFSISAKPNDGCRAA